MSTWEGLNPPYGTIVADPPWEYPEGFAGGHSRTPGRWEAPAVTVSLPYSSMDLAAIRGLPVEELAAADARLFLWTTNKYLPDAFDVCAEWGFRYRQTLVWHKRDANTPGSIAANSIEFVLVATKGKPARLGVMPSALISTARRKTGHSSKPDALGDAVEQVSPGPYVELFCRRPRFGWDSWGHGYEIGAA